jgi:hypothetical protein
MSSPAPTAAYPPHLITVNELCEKHVPIKPSTVWSYIRAGKIPARKLGRTYLLDPAEVIAALDAIDTGSATGRTEFTAPDRDWVAEQVAKFSPDDLRAAASVLATIARGLNAASNGGAK